MEIAMGLIKAGEHVRVLSEPAANRARDVPRLRT